MSVHTSVIDPDCHIPSFDVTVLRHRMRYLSCGNGNPILFVHGIPTYSYVWRNIMPSLADLGQCVALDLIGMGDSDKPPLEYNLAEHIRFFDAFVDALQLRNVTLVMHGWGSVIGLDYAARHPQNIRALVCYESYLQPIIDWQKLSLPVQQLAVLLKRPGYAYREVVDRNYFIQKFIPQATVRALTEAEMAAYARPFRTKESRKLLWQFTRELPLGSSADPAVIKCIQRYSSWLQKSNTPKLLLYSVPGFNTTIESVMWAKHHLPNLTLAELPDTLHFAQESEPMLFAEQLRTWLQIVKQ